MIAIVANPLPASPQAWLDVLWILTVKATLVFAMASLAALALRRASAAARHLVWSAALMGALGLVPLTLWGPGWSVPGLSLPRAVVSETLLQELMPRDGRSELLAATPAPRPTGEALAKRAPAPIEAPAMGVVSASAPGRPAGPGWPAMLLALWAAGAAAMLGALVLGAFGLAHVTRRARAVTDRAWLDLLDRCRDQIGVKRPVELLAGDRLPAPCTWGLLQPRLLIPAEADQWPEDRKRVVLLHELAHVARHDCLLQGLAQLACSLFWFHPLAWFAAQRLRIERELACDDLVLQSDTRASDYADHLLAVVRAMRESRLSAIGAVAFARRSQFEGRLLAVLDPRRARGALTWRRAWPAVIAAATLILPLAALRPWVDPAGAGLTLFHGDTRPEDGPASEVLRSSEAEGSLTQRLGWAFSEARRRSPSKGFWVAYRIPGEKSDGGLLSDSAPLDLSTLDDEWPGPRMSDAIAGRSTRGPKPSLRTIVIAFHYPRRASRPDAMDRIRVQTEELPAAFQRQPLFWLGDVDDGQSLAWMISLDETIEDRRLRSTALDAIAHHGDAPAVRAHLVALLRSDADEELRGTAAERLARFPDRPTIDLLNTTLRRDRSADVRQRAIQALGEMESPQASRLLLELARDQRESDELRRSAIEALGQKASHEASESLDALIDDVADDVAGGIAGGIADDVVDEIADEASESVTEGLQEVDEALRETDEAVREAQKDARADAKDIRDVKDLKDLKDLEDLEDEKGVTLDGDVRIVGRPGRQDIEVLGDNGLPEVTIQQRHGKQVIQTHQEDRERLSLQLKAVESLGQMPDEISLSKLVRIARTHPNLSVRLKALETIGQRGTASAFEAVKEFVRDEDPVVTRKAIEALGHFPDEQHGKVMQVLDDLIWKSRDESLQSKAVEIVGQIHGEQSLSRLERIARTHPSVSVRRKAIEWISQFDPDEATPILERLIDS